MCRVVLSVLLAAAALLACILRQYAFLLGMADSVFHVEEHRCWLMAELGSLPQLGDTVARALPAATEGDAAPQDVEFTVTELDGRRAARLRLERLGAGATGEPIQ